MFLTVVAFMLTAPAFSSNPNSNVISQDEVALWHFLPKDMRPLKGEEGDWRSEFYWPNKFFFDRLFVEGPTQFMLATSEMDRFPAHESLIGKGFLFTAQARGGNLSDLSTSIRRKEDLTLR